jgi:hypothetical protein
MRAEEPKGGDDAERMPNLMMGHSPNDLGFRVQGSGFRVQDLGFRDQGSGFRVQGLGFRV